MAFVFIRCGLFQIRFSESGSDEPTFCRNEICLYNDC
uniref:Uncharacterized protein n=1 Tax=viral metagenome TaxID=1070528 RepID=A0A6C0KBA8_9ZZZZ